jgi:hypothetical protein
MTAKRGDWRFPNAIAISVRRLAAGHGQTADRAIEPDPDGRMEPRGEALSVMSPCPEAPFLPKVHVVMEGSNCHRCGVLIDTPWLRGLVPDEPPHGRRRL